MLQKNFNILANNLDMLHFDSLNKIIFISIFSFLETLAKPFFPCSFYEYKIVHSLQHYYLDFQIESSSARKSISTD